MMALFEIEPTDVNRSAIKENFTSGRLAEVKLTYELPGKDDLNLHSYSGQFEFTEFKDISKCHQFSASVAMFGSLLRGSQFVKGNEWNELINLANSSYDQNDLLQKEFVSLIQKSKALYTKTKKKKNESRND
jgi:hypothetical protein